MAVPQPYRPALLAAMVALALYAITLKGTYIEDDIMIVRDDPRLYESAQWKKLLTEEYWPEGSADNLYRPLVSLSFALQWHLMEEKLSPPASLPADLVPVPAGVEHALPFHIVNWILNAAVAAMVAELARRLSGPAAGLGPAYLAGLLFAVHPIHVEAIAGLVGRAEMMCAIGILGSLILLLHRPITTGRAIAVVGCLAAAIFSKEQGMLIPLLMLLLPLCLGVDRPNSERERRAVMLLVLMVCWFTAAYIVIREMKFKFEWDTYFLDWTDQPMVRSHGMNRVLMPLVLLGHYAQLLIFPIHLSPDYGGSAIGWTVHANDPYLYTGAAVAIGYGCVLAALATRPSRQARGALFCVLATGVLYGMVGNILSLIGTNFAERLMYLPSAFLLIAAGIAIAQLPKPIMIAIATIALLLGSMRTFTYASEWNDRLHFYELASAEQPRSIRLHMLVAIETLTQRKFAEAEAADRAGRELLPDYGEVWIQSAQVAMAQGKYEEADEYLAQAMKVAPSIKVQGWIDRVAAARKASSTPATQNLLSR
jgi:protein O-mannosyl-transferase